MGSPALRFALALAAALTVVPVPAAAQLTPLGAEFRVNRFTGTIKGFPKVAVAKGGSFQVVWRQGTGPFNAFVRSFNSSGAPLANEQQVNAASPDGGNPTIASLSAAGAFVVSYGGNNNTTVNAALFDSTGAPGLEFRVDTYTSDGAQKVTSVAADSSGNFVVVWKGGASGAPTTRNILGQRFNSAGTPLGGNFTIYSAASVDDLVNFPVVSVSEAGSFVVAWTYTSVGSSSNYDVFARRYASSGSPLGAAFQVNTYTTGNQYWASAATDSSGNFVVVWSLRSASGPIRARRYTSSGTAGPEFQVSVTDNTDFDTGPGLVFDPGGRFLVVWQVFGFADVVGRAFDASASPIGSEFRVNTYTTYSQARASAGVDASGNFVVSWGSQANVGISTPEIYAQRYCPQLLSVSIAAAGGTNVCPGQTGTTLTVTDLGLGSFSHQWGYRTVSGGAITSIGGQTGTTYVLNTGNTLPAGTAYIVCTSVPSSCGSAVVSNEITVFKGDVTAPAVSAPASATTTQTLCQ
ncbi:MAG TPA: hypothetical protein VGR00_14060 [Thermoanaerobaculia bacterium]|nr:hypothetical protein [Thermoanaerobaculia bacterium]